MPLYSDRNDLFLNDQKTIMEKLDQKKGLQTITSKYNTYYRQLRYFAESLQDALKKPGDIKKSQDAVVQLFLLLGYIPTEIRIAIIKGREPFIGNALYQVLQPDLFKLLSSEDGPTYVLAYQQELKHYLETKYLQELEGECLEQFSAERMFDSVFKAVTPLDYNEPCDICFCFKKCFGELTQIETERKLGFSNPFNEIALGNINENRNYLNEISRCLREPEFQNIEDIIKPDDTFKKQKSESEATWIKELDLKEIEPDYSNILSRTDLGALLTMSVDKKEHRKHADNLFKFVSKYGEEFLNRFKVNESKRKFRIDKSLFEKIVEIAPMYTDAYTKLKKRY